jgi:peptidoglycan-N-acetylglucosamine deacetylase
MVGDVTVELLLKYGFAYDHSQAYGDFVPFYARAGEQWTNVDYSKTAREWMKPLAHGKEIDLVEIGANWYVDDLPPMFFIKASPNSHGFVNPRQIEELWRDQFDWCSANSTTPASRSPFTPTSAGGPRCCSCSNASSRTSVTRQACTGRRWKRLQQISADGSPFAGYRAPRDY